MWGIWPDAAADLGQASARAFVVDDASPTASAQRAIFETIRPAWFNMPSGRTAAAGEERPIRLDAR